MNWLSVTLDTDAATAAALTDALLDVGAISAMIEDADAGTELETPQFGEPGMPTDPGWERSRVNALFPPETDLAAAIGEAAAAIQLTELPSWTVEEIAEQNWVQLTQSQFDPIRISDRLWIVPSWHEAPTPDAINLILDPGMAFGTGSHPTTRLCLEWLERHYANGCAETLLDYGCGSGILAIAGARMGATQVTGVDIDPQAVDAARANAERNEVTARFADLEQPLAGQWQVVVANILANPLKALAPAISAHVAPGGWLVLSGILDEQADDLIAIYAPHAALTVADRRDGWVCLAGRVPA
jgi:ribosomal protein L11 methyltransferase